MDVGSARLRCAIGRSGISRHKREGDGATPTGTFGIVEVWVRRDRVAAGGRHLAALRASGVPVQWIRPDDGWCDAVGDRNYNRAVRHPYPVSAERMWREDGLYDVVVVLDYNIAPRAQGRGSAIFLHCARPDYAPTEGCIALAKRDVLRLLARLGRGGRIVVG